MEIPIFPLNGAVLFPGTSLPLNIFEKRYIEMVDYALSNDRFIGMIQSDEKNKLYNIGCIGKIHSFSETTDGRYLISLQGTNCFKVKKELEKKYKFRLVEAEMLDFEEDKNIINENQKNNLYNIGCIGKIHSFSETTDGRYLISLQGTNCFKVKKELEKKI